MLLEGFNVEQEDYTLAPVMSDEMEKDSLEVIINKAVLKVINRIRNLFPLAQNKQLSETIYSASTVEQFLINFASWRTGSYALSAPPPSWLVTAATAWNDKTDSPAEGISLRSSLNFTANGAYAMFDGCTTPHQWLVHVFGSDYDQKVARGYFVD